MIISREYVPFRDLILRHDKGGELFKKLSKKSYPKDIWEEAYIVLAGYALYEREMGWAFYGIWDLINGFQKLDEEEPYETGYSFEDARCVEIIHCNENEMTLLLRTGEERGRKLVGMIKVPNPQK